MPTTEEEMIYETMYTLAKDFQFHSKKEAFSCGHCNVKSHAEHFRASRHTDSIKFAGCANCGRINVFEVTGNYGQDSVLLYPRCLRENFPIEVPPNYVEAYHEALNTLPISIKGSASLSRYCLQLFLLDIFKVKKGRLVDQVKEVMPKVTSNIHEQMEYLRSLGNFGSHPNLDINTEEIYTVSKEEAELSLFLLKSLFDEYLIKPKRFAAIKNSFKEKESKAKTC